MKNNKSYKTTNSKKLQSGLSLFELLIAMFIGLFLLAGISSSYLTSKKTSIKRTQYSELEDNGRVALEIIHRTLEHTGYTTSQDNPLEDKFILSDVNSKTCNDASASVLLDPTKFPDPDDYDDDASDSIGVVYLGSADISVDCAGSPLIASCQLPNVGNADVARIYSAFFVDKTDATQAPKLQCAGSRSTELVTIAEGVENMQILYGVDVNNDNTVIRYVSEPADDDWDKVISIQVGLLMRSLKEVNEIATERKFSLLDTPITTNDRYQRAVFSTTVSLRNSLN